MSDGRLYGRGAHDMKGSLAACLGAVKALVDAGVRLRGDLVVAAVADEEYGSLGTADLIERVDVDGAIVTEPTNLEICLAHKGYIWIEVETTGRAAHGSRFAEGVDANMRMGRFLAGLDQLEQALRAGPPHPLVGPPSLHAAMLKGGSGLSTYAASCTLKIERRTVPGETEADARRRDPGDRRSARGRRSDVPRHGRAVLRARAVRGRRRTRAIVAGARRGGRRGARAARRPLSATRRGWTRRCSPTAGIETVVFGPLGAGEHSAVEWVDLDSVVPDGGGAGAARRSVLREWTGGAPMRIPVFEMERMQSTWENLVEYDMSESGVRPRDAAANWSRWGSTSTA